MDPQTVFCPNLNCPARGQLGKGNIHVHSVKEHRYFCDVCQKTFTETKGTPVYRLRKDPVLFTLVVTLLAWGCPVQAIVVAFRLDERTVYAWATRAGIHCEQVHEHLVQQPRDLGQVQADEIRAKMQNAVVWIALALQVQTRLWLGGVVAEQRNLNLLTRLIKKIRASALCRPLLVCVDGFKAYVRAIQHGFREAIPRETLGRPRLRLWDTICIGQMVKQYAQGHVVGVVRRIIQGAPEQVAALLQQTQGGGVTPALVPQDGASVHTAYVERLNATFRARLRGLVRRGRALARQASTLHHGLYLVGTVYNFCTDHDSLRIPGIIGGHKWLSRTPAMATGITDHQWTVQELLSYRVPSARWTPPKRRGRVSYTTKRLIQQWCG